VHAFQLDGGIVYTESCEGGDLDFEPIWQEQHVLIAGSKTGVGVMDAITWSQAAQRPLCLLTPDMQNRTTIDRVVDGFGLHPRPCVETNSIISMLAHVAIGTWCASSPGVCSMLWARHRTCVF